MFGFGLHRKQKDHYTIGIKRRITFLFRRFRVVNHKLLGPKEGWPVPFLWMELKNGSEVTFYNVGDIAWKLYPDFKGWKTRQPAEKSGAGQSQATIQPGPPPLDIVKQAVQNSAQHQQQVAPVQPGDPRLAQLQGQRNGVPVGH